MADYRTDEDPNRGFKLTFVGIAAAHLVLLGGLLLATVFQPKKQVDTVVWMKPGSFGGDSAAAESPATPDVGPQTASSEPSRPEEAGHGTGNKSGSPASDPASRGANPAAHPLGIARGPFI